MLSESQRLGVIAAMQFPAINTDVTRCCQNSILQHKKEKLRHWLQLVGVRCTPCYLHLFLDCPSTDADHPPCPLPSCGSVAKRHILDGKSDPFTLKCFHSPHPTPTYQFNTVTFSGHQGFSGLSPSQHSAKWLSFPSPGASTTSHQRH